MIILIQLGGIGDRFKVNGYDKPKSLIDVNNKPILFHLIANLTLTASDIDFVYIPYNKEYANYNFETLVKTRYPSIQFHFFKLLENTRGAVETINISLNHLISTEVIRYKKWEKSSRNRLFTLQSIENNQLRPTRYY